MAVATEPVGPPEGSLDTTTLPSLLAMLADDGQTGVLRIDGGSEVWLHDGRTCLATTPSSPELAKVLYDSELGPADSIAAALADTGSATGPADIDALLAEHPEAEEPLRRLLHEHNLGALFELLVPSGAAYRFEADARHPLGSRFAEDTTALVAAAQQRLEIWRRIAARIPSTGTVFTLAAALPAGAEERAVTADEWRFLALLDGRRSVADLIAQTGESAFRVCSSLYRLLLEDLIVEQLS